MITGINFVVIQQIVKIITKIKVLGANQELVKVVLIPQVVDLMLVKMVNVY